MILIVTSLCQFTHGIVSFIYISSMHIWRCSRLNARLQLRQTHARSTSDGVRGTLASTSTGIESRGPNYVRILPQQTQRNDLYFSFMQSQQKEDHSSVTPLERVRIRTYCMMITHLRLWSSSVAPVKLKVPLPSAPPVQLYDCSAFTKLYTSCTILL